MTGTYRSIQRASARRLLALAALAGLLAGGAAWLLGYRAVADAVWGMTTLAVLLPLTVAVIRETLGGRLGVDLIALVAMGGSLVLGEYLAGGVIALMLAGGGALEEYAGSRARRELSSLANRAPQNAHRLSSGGLETLPVSEISAGERLLVKAGEVVPVDGDLDGTATLDESALTGEARPVVRGPGDRVASGVVNSGPPFEMTATATAAASTYAGIVRLAEEAQRSKAPFVRLADRYALVFLPATFAIAAAAWILSGDPVRGLAVLVVATPCPLILAAPVAIVSGISRAASRGLILKNGAALEALATAQVLLVDKTGTLTTGRPQVVETTTVGSRSATEVLTMAASLEQVSAHVFAPAIVSAARLQGLSLTLPTGVVESAGVGISGLVDGHEVRLGRRNWVSSGPGANAAASDLTPGSNADGRSTVFVGVDGAVAGALALEDPLREDAGETLRSLRAAGIRRIVMLTGDRREVAQRVGASLGIDEVLAERTAAEKVEVVYKERARGRTVMVGDGINDAGALSAADVGVAMGARGATASSEAADAVLVTDQLGRLGEAMLIARRARGIAVQSVVVGMGLSGVAMLFAAAGALAPVTGAVVQEAIDVAVILNALRALGWGGKRVPKLPGLRVEPA